MDSINLYERMAMDKLNEGDYRGAAQAEAWISGARDALLEACGPYSGEYQDAKEAHGRVSRAINQKLSA